jgi:hypothetical protein
LRWSSTTSLRPNMCREYTAVKINAWVSRRQSDPGVVQQTQLPEVDITASSLGSAGLESIVRGAAVLSGAPARLLTVRCRIPLRVLSDSRQQDSSGLADGEWRSLSMLDLDTTLWLEKAQPCSAVDAVIFECGIQIVQIVLDRTPFRAPRPEPMTSPWLRSSSIRKPLRGSGAQAMSSTCCPPRGRRDGGWYHRRVRDHKRG